MKPVIKVENLSKYYYITHKEKADYGTLKDDFTNILKKPIGKGSKEEREKFWALKDINFEINQGEAFGIIGKNGSGKSTLLKILSRIVDPTTGRITMQGKTASMLEVGTGFHPELTGRENVFFNGSMIGMSRQEIRRKFDDIVAFSEVEQFLDTPVKFYSSGMYVRLAFSVAAHLEPDILILDEVLSVGDAGFQKKSLDKMMSISKSGRTILFVSHSMSAVEDLCDRAMLLQNGKVKLIGETAEVAEAYLEDNLPVKLNSKISKSNQPKRVEEKFGSTIIISKLSCSRTDGKFLFGENLSFNLSLENKGVDRVVYLGLGVTNPSGERIFTFESTEKTHLTRRQTEVSLVFKSPKLQPGIYFVDVGVRGENETLDFIPQALSFKVTNKDAKGNAHQLVHELNKSGFVLPEAHIRSGS